MKLSDVKKLHQKKYRSQFGYYLVEGEHLVLELLNAVAKRPETLSLNNITFYVTPQYAIWLNEKLSQPCRVDVLSEQQMASLSDTKTPQGIIARVPLPQEGASSSNVPTSSDRVYVYLYETQDPGNLGTILRTLAWFGDFTLLMSPNSVDPYNSKVVRSSMGAIFHVNMELNVPLGSLNQRFQRFAYLDMKGEEVKSPTFRQHQCYLFGNEARGVPTDVLTELNAKAYTIPGNGSIDSLNLASAVNMCAYELSR